MATEAGVKLDNGKLRYSLIPPEALEELAKVMTFGAEKYTPNGWKSVPEAKERYMDALFRHIEKYRKGEKFDNESNISHLSHALTNIAFLIWFEKNQEESNPCNKLRELMECVKPEHMGDQII